jgi:hypothetical protein
MDMLLHHVYSNIFLSLESESRARGKCCSAICHFVLAVVDDGVYSFSSVDLGIIVDFRKAMDSVAVECKSPVDRVIVCPSSDDKKSFNEACKILGTYLILTACMPLAAVVDAFYGLHDPFITHADSAKDITTMNCWHAIDQSKRLGWLVDPKHGIEPALDLVEFEHHASSANGGVHMAVPGTMLFFPSTGALPCDQVWIDSALHDGGAARHFSPSYYADLFLDLGVSDVVCLGRSDPAAAAAFAARGIEPMDLGISAEGGGGTSLLHGLDLLLSLAAAAPGIVAVHSGDGFRWPAYAERLVAAVLISRLGFGAGAATAWTRMLCPWMAPPDSDAAAAAAAAAAPPGVRRVCAEA